MYGELFSVVLVCSTLLFPQVDETPDQYLFNNDLNKECRSLFMLPHFFSPFVQMLYMICSFDALNIIYVHMTKNKLISPIKR